MDILIKNMEMPSERIMLEVFPDGKVFEIHPNNNARIPTEAVAIPVVHCKDCDNFNEETHLCSLWGSWTSEDGFCHKAFGVLERTT